MKKKRAKNKTRIPEALGNRACSVWLYVLVFVSDAAVHGTLLYFHGLTPQSFFRPRPRPLVVGREDGVDDRTRWVQAPCPKLWVLA